MDPKRYRVLDIDSRALRVANLHRNTLNALTELLESAGLEHPRHLTRRHVVRRLSSSKILLLDQIYPKVEHNALFANDTDNIEDDRLKVYWDKVSENSFDYQ
jgi:hypothetical protein